MAVCFVSYSHSPLDEVAVRFVAAFVERHGLGVWWDECLAAKDGLALNDEIATAISGADVVLVLVSSQSLASRYCQAEVGYALALAKRIIRIDLEAIALPGALLPLAAARTVVWYGTTQREAEDRLAGALVSEGLKLALRKDGEGASEPPFLDDPDAAVIRPTYGELRSAGADRVRDFAARVSRASLLNAENGFNHLSLSFLWLFQGDTTRALDGARAALLRLPREPDAHYAEALARCAATPRETRSRGDVEEILRRLAVARRLPKAGAHIDLLSAAVIANYYLPRYLTPPAQPADVLAEGRAQNRCVTADECLRCWTVEPIVDPTRLGDPRILAHYGIDGIGAA